MLFIVALTALVVGGATMLGAAAGYLFRGVAHRLGEGLLLSFAAGMMLSAAVAGLILPSLEGGGVWRLPLVLSGVLCGGDLCGRTRDPCGRRRTGRSGVLHGSVRRQNGGGEGIFW